jgi:hypothetical protein
MQGARTVELKRLFSEELGLEAPWHVTKIEFIPEKRRLHIAIDFSPGSEFHCPACGTPGAKAYDTSWEEWGHPDFFRYAAYLQPGCPGSSVLEGVG